MIFFFHRGATGRGALTGCVIFHFFFENLKMPQLEKLCTLKIFTFSLIMKQDRHFPPHVQFGGLPFHHYYKVYSFAGGNRWQEISLVTVFSHILNSIMYHST